MACAIVARGCVYGMQEFLDVASKEFMDEFFEVSMIFRRIQCRKNEEQEEEREDKQNTQKERGIPNPGGAFIPPTPPDKEKKE